MGFFSRRKQAESALSQTAGSLSSQDDLGEVSAPSEGIVDPLAARAGGGGTMAFPGFDPNDPMAAMRVAQEAFENSPLGSGPLSHLPMAEQVQKQLADAMAQAEANMKTAHAYSPPGGFPGAVAAAAGAAAAFPAGPTEGDTISQLERLDALRASGALTEGEFAEQKRRVLGEG